MPDHTLPPTLPFVGRQLELQRLLEFANSGSSHATLGVVWGRRRVGKSYLLRSLVERQGGFYYEAVRGSRGEALRELGTQLGAYQGAAAPLALESWEQAADVLWSLGAERETVVVLDEFPYLLEHSPGLDSTFQRAFGPQQQTRGRSQTRLLLCGSAMSTMRALLGGTAPLRGRASLDLRVSPFDYRTARTLHGSPDADTALHSYSIIGGVAAYAREMCDGDLPDSLEDVDRWVARRVLSPAAPLFNEVELLLSEDPVTAKARKLNLYHATLAGVATGHHAWSSLTNYIKIAGPSLAPIIDGLVAAEFVERLEDPVRENRPTYHPADSLLRFHYALIRRRHSQLARHDADALAVWRDAQPTYRSQVLGPCFEGLCREWTASRAGEAALGERPAHVGPTSMTLADGTGCQLDVVAARDDGESASARTVLAIGEAKVGEQLSRAHVARLELARQTLGPRAAEATLLLFGRTFTDGLRAEAVARGDLELVSLGRLYGEGEEAPTSSGCPLLLTGDRPSA